MTLQERLADAENAYHDLQTGKAVVEVVDQNGEKVRYNVANSSRLLIYISSLKSQINGLSLAPMQFWGRP